MLCQPSYFIKNFINFLHKNFYFLITFFSVFTLNGAVPQIVIHWSTSTELGSTDLLKDRNGNLLDAGSSSNGDGYSVVLGFYDAATISNPFNGNWVPLTTGTKVGDSSSGYGYENGMFSFTTLFTENSNQVVVYPNEPASYQVQSLENITSSYPSPNNKPFCIRIYDEPTASISAYYNTITGTDWIWPQFSPNIPENLYIKVAHGSTPTGTKWKYGGILENGSDFQTTLRAKVYLNINIPNNGGSASHINPAPFYYGDTVDINASAFPHWDFVRWDGTGVTNPFASLSQVQMTADRNISAIFSEHEYNVNVTPINDTYEITGGGTTTKTNGPYHFGDSVSIAATPNFGYQFSHWSGNGPENNNSTTTFSISGDHQVNGHFIAEQRNLNISANIGGTAQILENESPPYFFDGNYTIIATPSVGYEFNQWTSSTNSENQLDSTTSNNTSLILNEDINVTANFTEKQYYLSVHFGMGGDLSLIPNPTLHGHFSEVGVNATPLTGYVFDKWEDNGSMLNILEQNGTVDMDKPSGGDKSVKALFRAQNYSATITSGIGGQVTYTPGPWEHFKVYDINASPSPGYRFSHWSSDNNSTDNLINPNITIPENSFTPTGTVNLKANFALIVYDVIVNNVMGDGNVSGGGKFTILDNVEIFAMADTGWHLEKWTGDIFAIGSNSTISNIVNLSAYPQNLTFNAHFSRNAYTLNLDINGSGLVNGSTSMQQIFLYEDNASLSATPSNGWSFDRWVGIPTLTPLNPTIHIEIVSDLNVTAKFIRNNYNLNITTSTFGDSNGSGYYPFENVVQVNTQAKYGYYFDKWVGDVQWINDPNASSTTVQIPDNNITIEPSFLRNAYSVSIQSGSNGTAVGGGSFLYQDSASLSANPALPDLTALKGYRLREWTWTNSKNQTGASTNNPLEFLVDANYSFDVSFEPIPTNEHDLVSMSLPSTGGQVYDNPNLRYWDEGKDIIIRNITASPNYGFSFLGWSNIDNLVLIPSFRSNEISVEADKNGTLTANFEQKPLFITTQSDEGGNISSENNHTFATFTAQPEFGYNFIKWDIVNQFTYDVTIAESTIDGSLSVFWINGTESPELNLVKGHTYTFNYNSLEEIMEISTEQNATIPYQFNGVDGNGSGTLLFSVPMDVNTSELYYVSNKSKYMGNKINIIDPVNDSQLIANPQNKEIVISSPFDFTLRADFEIKTYNLTATTNNGGSVTSNVPSSVTHGTTISLIATPDDHFYFSHWEGITTQNNFSDNTTAIVTAHSNVKAVFKPIPYSLTLTRNIENAGNVLTSNNIYVFHFGDQVSINAIPAYGYSFDRWSSGVNASSTTILIEGNTSIEGIFKGSDVSWNEPIVVTQSSTGKTIESPQNLKPIITPGAGTQEFGRLVELNATSNLDGYQFLQWERNGTKFSDSPQINFSLEYNNTLYAVYQRKNYLVDIESVPRSGGNIDSTNHPHGHVSPVEELIVEYGESLNLTAIPNTNFEFSKWEGSQSSLLTNLSLNISAIKNPLNIRALFVPTQNIAITINVVPEGAGWVFGDGVFSYDPYHPVFAKPNLGYIFDRWEEVSGSVKETSSSSTTILLNENKFLKAIFIEDPNYVDPEGPPVNPGIHNIKVVASPSEAGYTTGSGTFGTSWINISAQSFPGFKFKHWNNLGVENNESKQTRFFLSKSSVVEAIFAPVTGTDLFIGSSKLNDNWWFSNWFGPFWHEDGDLWAYHYDLGWLYVMPQDSSDSNWIWFPFLDSWQWTSWKIFPYLHKSKNSTWMWYNKDISSPQKRYFFQYSEDSKSGYWINL